MPVKPTDKIATIIARTIIGIVGLAILWLLLRAHFYALGVKTTCLILGFFGLLLGYAFGGDKWGARLFGFFTGHRVRVDESSKANNGRWFLFVLMGLLLLVVLLAIRFLFLSHISQH
jgi:uncharacterized membrane protein